jgi:nitroreductase
MSVAEAVAARRSCRAFLSDAIDADFVRDVLVKASRAASGGNVQPWRIYLLHGERMDTFKAGIAERVAKGLVDTPEYPVYPSPLKEPYRTQRFAVGEEMYARLGIPREDKMARLEWFANNYQFFGAPMAVFVAVDIDMVTVTLLLEDAGLASCSQECWSVQHKFVSRFVGMPAKEMLFAGIAIGKADVEHPVNGFMTARAAPEVWLRDA